MMYLVTHSDVAGDDKVFCEDEVSVVELIESKIKEGASENDINVYEVSPVNFQVERVPVVKLHEEADMNQISQTESVDESFAIEVQGAEDGDGKLGSSL